MSDKLLIVDDTSEERTISEEEMREYFKLWFSADLVSFRGTIYEARGQ